MSVIRPIPTHFFKMNLKPRSKSLFNNKLLMLPVEWLYVGYPRKPKNLYEKI